MARRDEVWLARQGKVRPGLARHGAVGLGMVWQARLGWVSSGEVGQGKARLVRQ